MLKRIKKECENILYEIEGITWVELIIVPPKNINDDNAKLKSITVRYETEKMLIHKKLEKQFKNFLNSLLEDSTTEIIIEDLVSNSEAYSIFDNAQKELENHNYVRAIDLIIEASKLNNYYSKYIDTIPNIIELDEKIKKDKKNYQYYIEKGDLLRLFSTSLYCNSEAIKNYEKALELNSNAYGVYEKIAQSYASLSMEYSIISDFSTDTKNRELEQRYKEKSAEYSLKAIKYSQGNNRIYQYLGHYYFANKDYNKALEYYNKINPSDDFSCKSNISNKKVFLL